MAKKDVEWVPKGGFSMPELPAELGIHPILAALLHMACFMEFSDEEVVDFDESLATLEALGFYLQRLTPAQVKEVNRQLKKIVTYAKQQKWDPKAAKFIRDLLKNAGM
jgi:hypothetical protein